MLARAAGIDALQYGVRRSSSYARHHPAPPRDAAMADYRIDYAQIDVDDLMEQVRARAAQRVARDPALPTVDRADVTLRLRDHLDLDDALPYRLQQELGLDTGWNVAPEDLYVSHPGAVGSLISALRRLLRPVTKLFVNADLPLHKQFKTNIGVAAALHDLMQDNAALRAEVDSLRRRLDDLEDRDRDGGA